MMETVSARKHMVDILVDMVTDGVFDVDGERRQKGGCLG